MPQFGIFPVFSSQKLTSNFLSQKRDVLCFDLKCDNPGCEIYNKIFFLAQKRLIFNGIHECVKVRKKMLIFEKIFL